MRRILLVVLITTIGLSSTSAQTQEEKPAPNGTVRVAVVDLSAVFTKYERAQLFKQEIEKMIAPFKTKGKTLMDQIEIWDKKVLAPGITVTEREQLETDRIRNKRQLCDLQRDLSKLIAKKQEDNLVVLWKEVQDGIKTYAVRKGFELVLGYGVPDPRFQSRKMQALDPGGSVLLHSVPGVDITEGVVELLNRRFQEVGKAKP